MSTRIADARALRAKYGPEWRRHVDGWRPTPDPARPARVGRDDDDDLPDPPSPEEIGRICREIRRSWPPERFHLTLPPDR
jgi:hypothetical protein